MALQLQPSINVNPRDSISASVASSQSTDNLGSVSAKEDCEISSEEEGHLARRLFRRSLRGSVGSAPGKIGHETSGIR